VSASTLDLTLSQFRLEQRSFWRNGQNATFNFGLPIVFVTLFPAVFGGSGAFGNVISFRKYFVAGMIGMALLSATYSNIAITLAFQRDLLILKRFRGTPLGAGPIFGAKVMSSVVIMAIQVALILGIGRVFYATALPKNPLPFLVALLVGIVVFSMAGVGYTAFIANADAAPAVVQLPFLVLQFISGVFVPLTQEPRWLRMVADVFPLRWLVDTVRAAYLGFDFVHVHRVRVFSNRLETVPTPVHGIHALTAMAVSYAVLAAWFVVFSLLAARRFRWEKRAG